MVELFEAAIGEPFVCHRALPLAAVHAAANPVPHGVGEVFPPLGFILVGKAVQLILFVKSAVQQSFVAHVGIATGTLQVMLVPSWQQGFV